MPKLLKPCFSFLLVLMTGCANPPQGPARVTPLTPVTQAAAPAPKPPAEPRAPEQVRESEEEEAPENDALLDSEPVLFEARAVETPNDWIAWEQFLRRNGWDNPETRPGGDYDLRTAAGLLSVRAGSRVAYWNGMGLSLGFVPRVEGGELWVHSLDAAKNFEPLLGWTGEGRRTKRVLVIDPGHGGKNLGAKSVSSGRHEKEYALDWALRLKPLLERKGWQVHLTRTNDTFISLSDRVAFAERMRADLFISLHFNAVEPPSDRLDHSGFETYCLTPPGMPSNLTRQFEDRVERVFPNNSFDEENLWYAARLHGSLLAHTGGRDRGIRRARFMTVLQGQNRPAVLLEGGFLSNQREARLIGTPGYRQKLAEAVAGALDP